MIRLTRIGRLGYPFGPPSLAARLPIDLAAAVEARLGDALADLPTPPTWVGVGLAPPKTLLPYVSIQDADENDQQIGTDGTFVAESQLQVICYAPTRAAARVLGELAQAAIQASPVQFAAGELMVLRRSNRSLEKDPDPAPGPKGGDCWAERRMFEYRYSYQN